MHPQLANTSCPLEEPGGAAPGPSQGSGGASHLLPIRCLGDLQPAEYVLLFGVVGECKPISQSKGTDRIRNFTLLDPTIEGGGREAGTPSSPLTINLFHPKPDHLLPHLQPGDVVCCALKVSGDLAKLLVLLARGGVMPPPPHGIACDRA